jgi:hypothetical protein
MQAPNLRPIVTISLTPAKHRAQKLHRRRKQGGIELLVRPCRLARQVKKFGSEQQPLSDNRPLPLHVAGE